jgi:NAD(P)-dependent dehydrogenase (short-subunit alcohol dehydrogenase family)
MMNLEGRVAVITGAGSGIGRAIALCLARRGCHVALADIDEPGLAQTQTLVRAVAHARANTNANAYENANAAGLQVSGHPLDVANRQAVAALPSRVLNSQGGVATSIARNARIAPGVPADELRHRLKLVEQLLRMPPEKAGEIIVRGVEKRRPRILVGRDALIVSLLERLAPVGYWRILAPRLQA